MRRRSSRNFHAGAESERGALETSAIRAYVRFAIRHRNPASTSRSSARWQSARSRPYSRCACSRVRRRPGISRNSPRMRFRSASVGTTSHSACARARSQFPLRLQPVIELVAGFPATRKVEVVGTTSDVVLGDGGGVDSRLRCAIGSRSDRKVGSSSRCFRHAVHLAAFQSSTTHEYECRATGVWHHDVIRLAQTGSCPERLPLGENGRRCGCCRGLRRLPTLPYASRHEESTTICRRPMTDVGIHTVSPQEAD